MKINNHNVSFKRVYLFPNAETLNQKNKEKLQLGIDMVEGVYPHNDVFFSADDKGNLLVQIEKENKLSMLVDDEICEKCGVTSEEMSKMIYVVTLMNIANIQLHNKKPPCVVDTIEDFENTHSFTFLLKLKTMIDKFNDEFKTYLN